ncbi:cell division protein ZipA C-terminal FtsZ-binding domain-containing protein [Methylotenera sp. G11]|uniref:cell division protein ZipA C-terminal FtsZ-binding domain-containing protein n=1 Tax=Methylotenera sp. G11 TaxID=1506585 RepID=UPI0006479DF5|nr:cell division protein ZipA C-terminal FtsZ-binding domain-containing protein [Methylotenera sp. G11]
MSDLQIVLIVIGGLIIVAVLVFNWWQERRFHQQVENNFSSIKSDALLEEPSLDTAQRYDTEDDPDHDAFSISHDLIHETPLAKQEPALETHDHIDDQALYSEPETTYIAPEAIQTPEISEAADAEMPYVEAPFAAAEHNDSLPQAKPVNHDGIKAIFQDAFSKSPDAVNTQELAAGRALGAADRVEPEAALAQSLPARLHAQVDLIALLHLADVSTVSQVSGVLKSDFDGFDKPMFIHVQTPDSRWLLLSDVASKPDFANQKISKIACSLQLADRAGPVTRNVVNRFQLAVESLGLDVSAHVEWQSNGDAVADAAALDAFCIDVDKTMGFHLLHGENGAFTGTKLRGLAEAQGLELSADGSFKFFDEAAQKHAALVSTAATPSFVMFNREHHPFSPDMLRQSVVKGITFQLDIPHVNNSTEAYNHMVQVAKQMETGLHAQLVDDNNRPLGDAQIEKIRHQLKIIQATMLTRGIVPGSDVAHRLFS